MTALITGATRGIGAALATELAAQGESVIGTCRGARPDADGIEWMPLDVTDPSAQTAMAQQLAGRPIDLLVCNAGIYPDKPEQLGDGFPPSMWAESFATNVTGPFLTVQALLPNLRLSAQPRIALIGSIMGSSTRAPGGAYIYRASKAALLNLGRNLAADLRDQGISVGIYHPGWVRTRMGGVSADIDVQQSARGLCARFAALGPDTTGCFEAWDGTALPV